MSCATESFNILATNFSTLLNHFDRGSAKLFSNLYLTKFLNTSNHPFDMYNTIDIKIAKSNSLIKLSKRITSVACSSADSDLLGALKGHPYDYVG